ncbi:MAG TPA: hypothetical protein VMS40_14435 [Vicinamibacterales bacterium]|nr:hypothetical protein [Vicinamibacterales bacterium]
MTTFARCAADGGCWVVAIALLGVYCGLQAYGERERHAAIAQFFKPRPTAAELTAVEPTDRSQDALTRP